MVISRFRGHAVERSDAAGVGFDPVRLERAFRIVERYVDEERIPGAVAAIGRKGRLVGPREFGWAAWQPERVKATDETIYDLASVSKVVGTTTATMLLLEAGELRLDDRAVEFVPEFGTALPADERRANVRIRHLLTHTSGLPAWCDLGANGEGRAPALETLYQTPLKESPGRQVEYSCLGFILLGEILRRLAGQDLDIFLSERLFKPLHMRWTSYKPPPEWRPRIAATELSARTGEVIHGVVHDENARNIGGISGNAGLFAPAADLAVFCQMLLNGGCYGGHHVLGAATVELMIRNHTSGMNEARGLGWVVKADDAYSSAGDLFSSRSFGHTGFTGTSLWLDPTRDLFVILLMNRVHPTRANDAHIRLRPLFHNAVIAALD